MPQHIFLEREQQPRDSLQLGELQQVYRCSLHTVSLLGFFALLTLVAAIIVLVATLPTIVPLTFHGWIILLIMLLYSLLLLVVPGLLVFATVVTWHRGRHTIALYAQGIVENYGSRTQMMRWNEMSTLQHYVTPGQTVNGQQASPTHSYEIQAAEKLKICFADEIIAHQDLFHRITQQATPFLFAQAKELAQIGQVVPFGRLMATKSGIELYQEHQLQGFLPWHEIESTQIGSQGQTIIKQKDNWHTWFEGGIPNTETFQLFVKDQQEQAAGRG